MKQVSIQAALKHVAEYPEPVSDDLTAMPVSELVARTLFDIANRPDQAVRGSMGRANKARKILLDRMVGKRRAGTRPLTPSGETLEFHDLTGGEISSEPAKEVLDLDG